MLGVETREGRGPEVRRDHGRERRGGADRRIRPAREMRAEAVIGAPRGEATLHRPFIEADERRHASDLWMLARVPERRTEAADQWRRHRLGVWPRRTNGR